MQYYKELEVLGHGAFGTVRLCQRIHNQQKVVIKQINLHLEGEELQAAKNEVSILKLLNHPNVIKYYDSFNSKNTFSIVMEYSTRGTLQQLILKERFKYFSPQYVMDIFCQILNGVDHIHQKKIVHRDLKCENIFLTGLKGDVVKIGDFGISKSLANTTMANTLIGTCNYLAPEICDGKPYNNKSDIWALGCILYELCEMQKLYEGPISNVVLAIASGKKKMVNTKLYGTQMQEIINMMLNNDPEKRPNTQCLISHADIFPTFYYLGTNLGCIDGEAAKMSGYTFEK